jgi:hypothetical protein
MHRGFLVQAYPDHPCRTDILERIHKLFGHAISTHGRVLFVRFDLTFPENLDYPGDNTVLQRFLDSIQHHCGRAGMASHYLWVREHNASRPNHHYHLVFLLGGDIPKSFRPILRQAEKHWALALGTDSASGLVDYCDRPTREFPLGNGIVLDRACSDYPGMVRYCYHWASYLAKTATKGIRPMGVREFGSSRLPSDSTFSAL